MKLSTALSRIRDLFELIDYSNITTKEIELPGYKLGYSYAAWNNSGTPGEYLHYESLERYNLYNIVTYINKKADETIQEDIIELINSGLNGKYIGTEHANLDGTRSLIEIRINWTSNQIEDKKLRFCFLYPEDEKLTLIYGTCPYHD